jgi:hypothetical protein
MFFAGETVLAQKDILISVVDDFRAIPMDMDTVSEDQGPQLRSSSTLHSCSGPAGTASGSGLAQPGNAQQLLIKLQALYQQSKATGKDRGAWNCAEPVLVIENSTRDQAVVKLRMACSTDTRPVHLSATNYTGSVGQHAQTCHVCGPLWTGPDNAVKRQRLSGNNLDDVQDNPASSNSNQRRISEYMWTPEKNRRFQELWVKTCVVAGMPIYQIAHPAFKALFRQQCGVELLSRTHISSKTIPQLAKSAKRDMKMMLFQEEHFQIGFDGGKTKHCESGTKMIGVTANLFNKGAVYMGTINTLDCALNTTAYTTLLSDLVQDCCSDWGKVSGIVHDMEPVCGAVVAQLQTLHPHLIDIPCQAHGFHNAAKDLNNLPQLSGMFAAVRTVITTVMSIKELRSEYASIRKRLGGGAVELQLSPDHRWGYSITEAKCLQVSWDLVHLAFQRTPGLLHSRSTGRAEKGKELIQDSIGYMSGDKKIGEGTNTFTLKELLDITVPALVALTDAISVVEADKPLASTVVSLWMKVCLHA